LTTAVETDKAADPDKVKAVEAATPEFHRRSARMPGNVVQFLVIALDRKDGSVLWNRTVCERAPFAATHGDGSWASGSPTTDGERLYAYFGSYGLYAFDLEGNLKWDKHFGPLKMKANFGEGTSPVLCGDLLIVSQDQEGPSFIVAFDKKTGEEKWRVERDEATAWSTPLVVEHSGRRQVVTSATKRIRSYAAATGELLWQATGMTANAIPCPVADKGLVFCTSGFRGSSLMAIRLAVAKGDITEKPEALAWSRDEDTPYVPSPLLFNGYLYFLKMNNGLLTCVDAATGKEHYAGQKLEGIRRIYASPVGVGDRLYITGRDGLTCVVKSGPKFEILARNKLDDNFAASAAIAGDDLFLRGYQKLYCISGAVSE
jgi:outer membrane protein assembly factor BamB